MVGPNLPFGGLACGLVLGPLPSGRDTWRSAKRQLYIKKKGGSVDDRSLYTRSSKEQGPNANKDSSAEAFKTGTSFKKSTTEVSV